MSKILCAIQSRLNSERLPRKAMLPLGELAMFYQVYRRIFGVHLDTRLVVPREDFDEYERCIKQYTNKFSLYGGSNENVYDRFVHASVDYDWVVRITADCPLICHDVITEMLTEFKRLQAEGVEYYSNDTAVSGYPDGLDVEIFTRDALLRYIPEGKEDEEHVTLAMKRHAMLRTKFWEHPTPWPEGLKLSVDTEEEYQAVKAIFDKHDGWPPITASKLHESLTE